MQPRKTAAALVLFCLPMAAGCGGKSAAEKATEAAALAKAGCDVFVGFKTPTATDLSSQIDATKATLGAFVKAADQAGKAADLDPKWKALESAAVRSAAAYEVFAKAAEGQTQVDRGGITNAVTEAKTARPLFINECAKADPKHFTASPVPSATPTPTGPTKKG